MGKLLGVVQEFSHVWNGKVLDVGCRAEHLKGALPNGSAAYLGLDLFQPAGVIGNLGAGLPFGNATFDTVVALDVLEHTDNIYKSFSELCRVARSFVLIALPNLYELKYRLKFLFGQPLSRKYGLPLDAPNDRHRWLFSFDEAKTFTHKLGVNCGFEITKERCLIGPKRGRMGLCCLTGVFPNLLSPWYVALLQRKERVL
jgi:hypothetical protein